MDDMKYEVMSVGREDGLEILYQVSASLGLGSRKVLRKFFEEVPVDKLNGKEYSATYVTEGAKRVVRIMRPGDELQENGMEVLVGQITSYHPETGRIVDEVFLIWVKK